MAVRVDVDVAAIARSRRQRDVALTEPDARVASDPPSPPGGRPGIRPDPWVLLHAGGQPKRRVRQGANDDDTVDPFGIGCRTVACRRCRHPRRGPDVLPLGPWRRLPVGHTARIVRARLTRAVTLGAPRRRSSAGVLGGDGRGAVRSDLRVPQACRPEVAPTPTWSCCDIAASAAECASGWSCTATAWIARAVIVELRCDVDFAGLFEVKEGRIAERAPCRCELGSNSLVFDADGSATRTELFFDGAEAVGSRTVAWRFELDPREERELCLEVGVSLEGHDVPRRFRCGDTTDVSVPAAATGVVA